jgi:hypothetical protein
LKIEYDISPIHSITQIDARDANSEDPVILGKITLLITTKIDKQIVENSNMRILDFLVLFICF